MRGMLVMLPSVKLNELNFFGKIYEKFKNYFSIS